MAASHMKHIHPVENNEQETGCPICPKTFTKIDHLKNHVWRHVNRVFPGTSKHNDMVTSTLGTYDLSIASTKTKYIKLNTKTQNSFCRLNENLMTFLYTLTGATRKQKEKKRVFSFNVYTKVKCY